MCKPSLTTQLFVTAALDDHKFMSNIIRLCVEECEIDEESPIATAAMFSLVIIMVPWLRL